MRISRDIHDEIGSVLTKIKLMSRNLSRASSDANELKETSVKISSASDELIQNLSEIVWSVNPANDSLGNVLAYMRSYASKLFSEQAAINLKLNFPEPEHIPDMNIYPEHKRNLLLIYKEALTNVIKHSQATGAEINVITHRQNIVLEIFDKGIGIPAPEKLATGNGLKNMRRRAEEVFAEIEIKNLEQGGTIVRLNMPFGHQPTNMG